MIPFLVEKKEIRGHKASNSQSTLGRIKGDADTINNVRAHHTLPYQKLTKTYYRDD